MSDSTLRFREEDELAQSLPRSGYTVLDVRGAPARPGKELVFIAQGLRGGSAQSLPGMQLSPPWSGSGGVPGPRS